MSHSYFSSTLEVKAESRRVARIWRCDSRHVHSATGRAVAHRNGWDCRWGASWPESKAALSPPGRIPAHGPSEGIQFCINDFVETNKALVAYFLSLVLASMGSKNFHFRYLTISMLRTRNFASNSWSIWTQFIWLFRSETYPAISRQLKVTNDSCV